MLARNVSAALAIAGFVASLAGIAVAKPLDPATASALATIERDAKSVAAGRFRGRSLQSPAREIGVAWSRAARVLARNGDVLVETKMANVSITKFEAEWRSEPKARTEAKDVAGKIADLIAAASS